MAKKKQTSRYPIVRVWWEDSMDLYGWTEPTSKSLIHEQLLASIRDTETTGYLISDTEEYITITSTLSFTKEKEVTILSPLTIPKCAIYKMKKI